MIEINKTIDLGHGNLETGAISKVEYIRVASLALCLTNSINTFSKFVYNESLLCKV